MGGSLNRWKKEIHKRDNYTCYYCGEKYDIDFLHLDHIIPKSQGGKDRKENLTTACETCNLIKGELSNKSFLEKVIKKYEFHIEQSNYFMKIISHIQEKDV